MAGYQENVSVGIEKVRWGVGSVSQFQRFPKPVRFRKPVRHLPEVS
jgi:hypothetical protein